MVYLARYNFKHIEFIYSFLYVYNGIESLLCTELLVQTGFEMLVLRCLLDQTMLFKTVSQFLAVWMT